MVTPKFDKNIKAKTDRNIYHKRDMRNRSKYNYVLLAFIIYVEIKCMITKNVSG